MQQNQALYCSVVGCHEEVFISCDDCGFILCSKHCSNGSCGCFHQSLAPPPSRPRRWESVTTARTAGAASTTAGARSSTTGVPSTTAAAPASTHEQPEQKSTRLPGVRGLKSSGRKSQPLATNKRSRRGVNKKMAKATNEIPEHLRGLRGLSPAWRRSRFYEATNLPASDADDNRCIDTSDSDDSLRIAVADSEDNRTAATDSDDASYAESGSNVDDSSSSDCVVELFKDHRASSDTRVPKGSDTPWQARRKTVPRSKYINTPHDVSKHDTKSKKKNPPLDRLLSSFGKKDGDGSWEVKEYVYNNTGGVRFQVTINGECLCDKASFSCSVENSRGETVHIDKFGIAHDMRYKGWGPKALSVIIELYRAAGCFAIDVPAPNTQGTKCYKKCGMRVVNGLPLRVQLNEASGDQHERVRKPSSRGVDNNSPSHDINSSSHDDQSTTGSTTLSDVSDESGSENTWQLCEHVTTKRHNPINGGLSQFNNSNGNYDADY